MAASPLLRGVVTERDVNALPVGCERVRTAPRTVLTPLARDALRQRGIAVHPGKEACTMKTATVVGRVWSSKRLPELPVGALIEVQLDCPRAVFVCCDPSGCGDGDRVLITIGAPAAWVVRADAATCRPGRPDHRRAR